MRYAHIIPALLILLLLACAPRAANKDGLPPALPISTGIDQHLLIPVGADATQATLAIWTLEPTAGTPIRGTILFTHGFLADHHQVANAAQAIRKAGYRAVLVDLRGWGESTGATITFGALDAHDLSQLTDALQTLHLCGPTVGIYGTSYGAAGAILFAAADPRVTTVVAVAPFANIREEVPSFSRNALGSLGAMLSDGALNNLANVVSDVAKLDLDAAKPVDVIAQSKAHILLIHGDIDTITPHKSSELLHAADPDRSEMLTVPGRGHLDLCFDIPGELQAPTRAWFDRYLAAIPLR